MIRLSRLQQWVIRGGLLVLLVVVLFPPLERGRWIDSPKPSNAFLLTAGDNIATSRYIGHMAAVIVATLLACLLVGKWPIPERRDARR